MNMCAAGWLDQARVAYPTTYSNPLCGFGHVGIVDYGPRRNLSETWDAFCYRMKGEEEEGGRGCSRLFSAVLITSGCLQRSSVTVAPATSETVSAAPGTCCRSSRRPPPSPTSSQ